MSETIEMILPAEEAAVLRNNGWTWSPDGRDHDILAERSDMPAAFSFEPGRLSDAIQSIHDELFCGDNSDEATDMLCNMAYYYEMLDVFEVLDVIREYERLLYAVGGKDTPGLYYEEARYMHGKPDVPEREPRTRHRREDEHILPDDEAQLLEDNNWAWMEEGGGMVRAADMLGPGAALITFRPGRLFDALRSVDTAIYEINARSILYRMVHFMTDDEVRGQLETLRRYGELLDAAEQAWCGRRYDPESAYETTYAYIMPKIGLRVDRCMPRKPRAERAV